MSFQIKPGVILRGGFAGSEAALGERDLAAALRETILSGGLNGDLDFFPVNLGSHKAL